MLSGIPADGKIEMISSGIPEPEQKVRQEFERVRGLAILPPALRGWTVDVLNVIRRVGNSQFSLHQIYQFEEELQALHPRNLNVRPKIRQQLQLLRDLGLIEFAGRGMYKFHA
jgi:type II restriction enzyme